MVILGGEKLCPGCRKATVAATPSRPARPGETEAASQSSRLAAALIDGLLVFAVVTTFCFAYSFILGRPFTDYGIAGFSYFGLRFVYEWQMIAASGQTLGKRICRIKVIAGNGLPLGSLAFLRAVARVGLGIIPGVGIIDLLFISSERGRTLHDRIAGTLVVEAPRTR
jgi:uncharacterized RDD family membrane protein YckC